MSNRTDTHTDTNTDTHADTQTSRFLSDLRQLLAKHKVDLELEWRSSGYSGCDCTLVVSFDTAPYETSDLPRYLPWDVRVGLPSTEK